MSAAASSPKPKSKAKSFTGFSAEKQQKAQQLGKFYVVGYGGSTRTLRGAPQLWKKEEKAWLEKGVSNEDLTTPVNYSVYIPKYRVSGRLPDIVAALSKLPPDQKAEFEASEGSWITIANWNQMIQQPNVQKMLVEDDGKSASKAATAREVKTKNLSPYTLEQIIAATKFTKDMTKTVSYAIRPAKGVVSPGAGRRTAKSLVEKVMQYLPVMNTSDVKYINVSEFPTNQGKLSSGKKDINEQKYWVSSFLPIFSTTRAGAEAALNALSQVLQPGQRAALQADMQSVVRVFASNADLTRKRASTRKPVTVRSAGVAAAASPRPVVSVSVPAVALPQAVVSPGAGGLVPAGGVPVLPGAGGFGQGLVSMLGK